MGFNRARFLFKKVVHKVPTREWAPKNSSERRVLVGNFLEPERSLQLLFGWNT